MIQCWYACIILFFPTNFSLPLLIKHKAVTEHITSHPRSAFSSQSLATTFKTLSASNHYGKKGISTLQVNVALSLLPACPLSVQKNKLGDPEDVSNFRSIRLAHVKGPPLVLIHGLPTGQPACACRHEAVGSRIRQAHTGSFSHRIVQIWVINA